MALVGEQNAKTLCAFLSRVLDFGNYRLHFYVQSVLSYHFQSSRGLVSCLIFYK